MASSWFLVLIPTKEYEARLHNINVIDSIDEKVADINGTVNIANEPTFVEETQLKDNVKHENTENNNQHAQNSVPAEYTKSHNPPMKLAQNILNKPNEELSLDCTYFELDLQEALKILNVTQATYQRTKNGNFYLVTFCIDASNVELASIYLQNFGIGNTEFTSISVVPTSIHIECPETHSNDDLIQGSRHTIKKAESSESLNNIPTGKKQSGKTSRIMTYGLEQRIDLFYTSIKSRMLVAEVVNGIKAGSEFTFDYLLLVVLASVIAFFGLLENSSVVLVASMLVSPIMGPILAGIFGCIIGDRRLRNRGIQHELISLGICILIGFVCGLVLCAIGPEHYYDTSIDKWPTSEMTSRGNGRSLITGIAIALPSGAGVALSVLGGNVGSLVGVAISASLLPPAVNAGLFWAIACAYKKTDNSSHLPGWNRTTYAIVNDTLEIHYHDIYEWSTISVNPTMDSFSYDAAWKGFVSLALTIVNIICIILMGVVILRIKEVTPDKIPQRFSSFWQQHVKTHRNYLREQRGSIKTRSYPDRENTMTLLEEVRDVLNVVDSEEDGLEDTFLHSLFEKARHDAEYTDILRATGKPAPIHKNSMALEKMLSRRVTVANNNEDRSMSILDAMRGSKQFSAKDDFATSPSKHFVKSTSDESDKNSNNKTLYNQAKMIQRSRSIGTGLSRRRRHKLSTKISQTQVNAQQTKTQPEQVTNITEPIKEETQPDKSESELNTEKERPSNDPEGTSKKLEISETSL